MAALTDLLPPELKVGLVVDRAQIFCRGIWKCGLRAGCFSARKRWIVHLKLLSTALMMKNVHRKARDSNARGSFQFVVNGCRVCSTLENACCVVAAL